MNYIINGKTVVDRIRYEIERNEKWRNKDADDIENTERLKEFIEFLIRLGGKTTEEERQRMEALVDRLTPNELVEMSKL